MSEQPTARFRLKTGSRQQVMAGIAGKTSGGLRKKDLFEDNGKIKSKKQSQSMKLRVAGKSGKPKGEVKLVEVLAGRTAVKKVKKIQKIVCKDTAVVKPPEVKQEVKKVKPKPKKAKPETSIEEKIVELHDKVVDLEKKIAEPGVGRKEDVKKLSKMRLEKLNLMKKLTKDERKKLKEKLRK